MIELYYICELYLLNLSIMTKLSAFIMLFAGVLSLNIFAQNSGVRFETIGEPGVEKNGQTIYANGTSEIIGLYMIMKNVSGDAQQYKWERIRVNISASNATDELCDNWQCYTPSIAGDNWVLGTYFSLNANQQTVFEPKLSLPEGSGGNATFKYYVLNGSDQRIDSVTVVFTSTLSLQSNTTSKETKIYPNPSNGHVTIKDFSVGSELEIVDMVGKVVLKTALNGVAQNIDLSSNPDGVYFYTIKPSDGGKTITKKLILRR